LTQDVDVAVMLVQWRLRHHRMDEAVVELRLLALPL
jgi:hypothetical protein